MIHTSMQNVNYRARTFRGPFADGMPPSALQVDAPPLTGLRPGDLGRLLVVLFVITWSVVGAIIRNALRRRRRTLAVAASDGLIDAFIRLGPTFVKAGQILASSGGLVPPVLAASARRCLDAVPPFAAAEVY